MRLIFSPHTYQIHAARKSPLARGVLAFLGLCLGLALLIEIAARAFFLPFPSLGSDNFYFDYKIYALEHQTRQNSGKLDCLIIGSSVANSNLNPTIIEKTYQKNTGQVIHCFNIGIPALTAENAIPVTESILLRYRPEVVLFILIPRDLMDHEFTVEQLETNPWVNVQRDEFNWQDWAKVHFYSIRYFITWQYWQTPSNRNKISFETAPITPAGYSKIEGVNTPYPRNWMLENDENLQNVWMQGQSYTTIDKLLALQKHGNRIIFIEAPAYSVIHLERDDPTIYHYENDYITNLQAYLQTKNVPFWRSLEIGKQIPEEGWFDWLHLNEQGAATFSQWAGTQLADYHEFFK